LIRVDETRQARFRHGQLSRRAVFDILRIELRVEAVVDEVTIVETVGGSPLVTHDEDVGDAPGIFLPQEEAALAVDVRDQLGGGKTLRGERDACGERLLLLRDGEGRAL
jgi:hypothetical protein